MLKTQISIEGMHCRSCEMMVEEELRAVKGIKRVNVSQVKGQAEIHHKGKLDLSLVSSAVSDAGYKVVNEHEKKPWFSTNVDDYLGLATSLLIFGFAYFLLSASGFEPKVGNNFASLPVVFLIGLTAGISTCMALVGGLVLGISSRFAEKNPHASSLEKFKPHLFFNIGRIVSFFVFGAFAGLLGSFFTMSTSLTGFLSILAGIAMLFMGIQLLSISPRLSGMSFTLPKSIARTLGIDTAKNAAYSNKNASILGALTFFLPCGFTQAVQLYAISTGSPLTASLTLGIFALGTTPGLLGVGGLTSIVKGAFGKSFFRFAGVVVIALSIFNISNGANLSGLTNQTSVLASASESTIVGANEASSKVQVLKSVYTVADDMTPANFTVKKGQPVRLEVEAKEDGVGCMGSLYVSGAMKRPVLFQKGKTEIVEFTPTKAGKYTIACAMGVPHGTITVN